MRNGIRTYSVIALTLIVLVAGVSLLGTYFRAAKFHSTNEVLVMNTERFLYRSGETVQVDIGFVRSDGITICDADMQLTITDPHGRVRTLTSQEGGIGRAPSCAEKSVSDAPDHRATFEVAEEGIYALRLTAVSDNGPIVRETTVEVARHIPFVVQRRGATRLYPQATYGMTITLRTDQAFSGDVREMVPAGFKVVTVSTGGMVLPMGDHAIRQSIVWPLTMVAGEERTISYSYDALAKSPAEYAMGPLSIVSCDGEVVLYRDAKEWNLAIDAVSGSGTIVYSDTTEAAGSDDNLNFRTYTDPTTVGSELTTVDTADTNLITFTKIVSSPTRDEKMAVHLKATGRMDILTCTTGCDQAADWTLRGTYATATSDADAESIMGFDVAYEQLSGMATVVFTSTTDTGDVYYCQWNGTSWSPATVCAATFAPGATNQIDMDGVGVAGQPEWIRLRPMGDRLTSQRTDEFLLGVSDSNDDMFLAHWTGSAWDNALNPVDDLSAQNARKFDLAWEETTGSGLVVLSNAAVANLRYSTYDISSGWSAAQTDGPANNGGQAYNSWIELGNDPLSDDIAVGTFDTGDDFEAFVWTGAAFTEGTDDITSDDDIGKNLGVQFTRLTQRAIWLFTDASALTSDMECWTSAGGFAVVADVGTTNIVNIDDVEDINLVASPNNDRMVATRNDIDDEMTGLTYSGATGCDDGDWLTLGTLETSVEGHADGAVGTVQLAHGFAYTPYSPWSLNWRFYDDETVDDPSTGLNGAAENTTPTDVDPNEIIRLRINMAERGGVPQTDTRKILQYTSGCSPNGTGGELLCTWTNVGDTSETSAVWRYATAAETCTACTDGGTSVTTRLTGSNQATPAVFYVSDKDAAHDTDFDHKSASIVELDFPLKAETVTSNTTYYFRLYEPTISSVGQASAVFREQDTDGNNDCASAVCTYPSLTTATFTPASITGTVYTNTGTTVIGANKTVAVSIDGAAATGTDDTDGGGQFTVIADPTKGSVLTLYLDDETEDAVTVTIASGSTMTGVSLYQNRLILRNETGSAIRNAHLATADNNADTDISAIYRMSESDATLQTAQAKELFIWDAGNSYGETDYVPGGRVKIHDLYVAGTMAMGTNGLTVSGSIVTNTGTFTTSTGTYLTSSDSDSGLPEQIHMGTNAFATLIIDNGLVGYWRLDDGTGATIIRDSSWHANNGTPSSGAAGLVSETASSLGGRTQFYNQNSVDFDGSDDVVSNSATTSALNTMINITVSGWVYPQSAGEGPGFPNIIQKEAAAGATAVYWRWKYSDEIGRLQTSCWLVSWTGTAGHWCAASNKVPLNTWTNVMFTMKDLNTTTANPALYINGVFTALTEVTSPGGSVPTDTTKLHIGNNSTGDRAYDGKIDDLRVYNRALSASEALAIANGNQASGSGYYVLRSNLDVNGHLKIEDSTLDVSDGNHSINVSGSWENNGDFIARSGTVTLDAAAGVGQTMSGYTVFNNFTKTVTSASSLFLDYRTRQNMSGALTLRGAAANLLKIRSTKTGSSSNLLLDGGAGTQVLDYADVQDSDASGGSELVCETATEGCTNSGNNTNWCFSSCTAAPENHSRGWFWFFGF